MANIIGIPTTRVSDLFVRQRLQTQMSYDQLELFRLEAQLSTGHRIGLPSEDPVAAMRIVSLQRLLERKEQVQTNLATNQSFLTATDTALSSVSSLMAEVRGIALESVGTTATDTQRRACAEQVQRALQQLVDTGNQVFRGRYLFSGSETMTQPFESLTNGLIAYAGNEARLSSYADIDLLFDTNLTGNEVFGAISEPVRGTADLDPILTYETRLADLHGGLGITSGSIEISNGSQASVIDISGAETIGDVAAMIRANAPGTSVVDVEITPTGLEISLDAGNLSIKEVRGGTTARELGILAKNGVGTGPVVGTDLDPILRLTTRLDDAFGVRARAVLRSPGADNDVIIEADRRSDSLNGVTIELVDDGTVADVGDEVAAYDPGTKTLTVKIKAGYTQAWNVVDAIEAAYDPVNCPFNARLDPLDEQDGGKGFVDVAATAVTRFGSNFDFDQDSGIQVQNGTETYTFTFSKADGVYTVEDLLNVINGSDANLLASINEDATGIDLRSRLSGGDFAIGENGGTTATELGLRSLTADTWLTDLNYGRGVVDYAGAGVAATATKDSLGADNNLLFTARQAGPAWNDFEISFVEQVPSGTETLTYDPVAKTMVFAVNPGVTTAADVIELFNSTPVARDDFEIALASEPDGGNDGSGVVNASTAASVTAAWVGQNNNLLLQARDSGPEWNGFALSFVNDGVAGAETLDYDPVAKTLVFHIANGVTTAARCIEVFDATGPVGDFLLAAADEDGSPNTGAGFVWAAPPVQTAGGSTVASVYSAGGEPAGNDFSITRNDGVTFQIDLDGADTIAEVLNLINTNADNQATGTPLVARLATYGNGIELVDNNPGSGTLTVTRGKLSTAAIDLGLIPAGQESSTATAGGAVASAPVSFAGANNDLIVRALGVGDVTNGVTVQFLDMDPLAGQGGTGVLDYQYDAGPPRTLSFWIDPGTTSANDVITLFEQDPPIDPAAVALFAVELDPVDGAPNDGTGPVDMANATVAGGQPDLLTGSDTDPQETEGLFTALLRLYNGLQANDTREIQRSIDILDASVLEMNFTRGELGARQQGLDTLQDRMESENVELQSSLSQEYDADLVETISNLTGRQAAFEASLKAAAQIFQTTLLDYL